MKTIKELLILLKDNIDLLENGLCLLSAELIYRGIITDDERKLRDYIYDNQPSKRSKFYGGPDNGFYYWPRGVKEPRLKWLNYHIKINK